MPAELAVPEPSDITSQRPFAPAELMQLAISKEGSIDVIERLAKLQMDFFDREDRIAFRGAMTRFKEAMPTVIRQRVIKDRDGNEKYRATALEDIATPVMKSLVALGVTYRWKTSDLEDGRIRCTCILGLQGTAYEEEGATLAAPPDKEGGKDALKAVGSTTSYLEKYTLMASVGMHVHATDPEAVPVVGVTNEQAGEWIEAIRGAETPERAMGLWKQAHAVAGQYNPIDYKAMTIFTEARDNRLKELRKAQ